VTGVAGVAHQLRGGGDADSGGLRMWASPRVTIPRLIVNTSLWPKAVVIAATLMAFLHGASARPRTKQLPELVRWSSEGALDAYETLRDNVPFRFSLLVAPSSNRGSDEPRSIGRGAVWLTFDATAAYSVVGDEPPHRTTVHEAALLEDAVKAKRRPTAAEVLAASLVARAGAAVKVQQTKELPNGDLLLIADPGDAPDHILILYAARNTADGSYIMAEVTGSRTSKALLTRIATSLKNLGRKPPESSELQPYAPLMMAAYDGRGDVVATLVRQGADPNRVDDVGSARSYCTALYFAVLGPKDDPAILETLLKAGARVPGDQRCVRPPLLEAVIRGKLASVRFLLSKGADPNGRSLEGWTPLAAVFANEDRSAAKVVPLLEELLRAGAAVNGHEATGGRLPLESAHNNPAARRLLLDRGADPRTTDAYGRTELDGLSSGEERHQEYTMAVSRLRGGAPMPVFSKPDGSSLSDLFRFGPEARIGLRDGAWQMIDPAGKEIGSWPACPKGCGPLNPQFLDLDGDRVLDVSGVGKDTSPCAQVCPPLLSFSLVLGLRGGQTRLMINYDVPHDRLTGNGPIPASLRGAVAAELERRGNLSRAHIERLLPRYVLMADGKWMYDLSIRHRSALQLYKEHQPAKAAALLEEPLAEATVAKLDPSRDPDVTAILNDLGFFLSEAGLDDRAVPVLRSVVARAPDRTVAYLNLADAEYTLGDAKTARGHYRQYLTLMESAGKVGKVPPRVVDRLAAH
jgi:hypothetical protein